MKRLLLILLLLTPLFGSNTTSFQTKKVVGKWDIQSSAGLPSSAPKHKPPVPLKAYQEVKNDLPAGVSYQIIKEDPNEALSKTGIPFALGKIMHNL